MEHRLHAGDQLLDKIRRQEIFDNQEAIGLELLKLILGKLEGLVCHRNSPNHGRKKPASNIDKASQTPSTCHNKT